MQAKSEIRDRLILLRRELNRFKNNHAGIMTPPVGLVGAVTGRLTKLLGGREARIRFYQWAFDDPFIISGNDLHGWQKFALVSWAKPAKLADESPWTFAPEFNKDCSILKMKLRGQHDKKGFK
jgi:hypothetical protein